jgi:two-component system sensor histidine kinase YesM
MRERLDPELVESILRICSEVSERDQQAALEILKSLRRVYAYILERDGSGVPLGEEMAFARDLLALEKLRLRNRLEVGISYDPALKEQLVPRRVLQPLIDNALIHGLSRELHTGRIHVNAIEHGGRCSLTVEDNGRGFLGDLHQDALRGEGGLSRVLRAAQELFGDEVILRLDKPEEAGTRVCLNLPRRSKEHHRDQSS